MTVSKSTVNFNELVLTPFEQEIEDGFENREIMDKTSFEKIRKELVEIAKNSVRLKARQVSSKREVQLLDKVKKYAEKKQLPYQTFLKSIVNEHIEAHG